MFLFYPTVSERFLVCWFPGGDVGGPEEKSQVTSLFSPSFLLQFESSSTHPRLAAGANRTQPFISLFSKPTAEVLTEYTRKVDFLKGLLEADKLVGGLLQLLLRNLLHLDSFQQLFDLQSLCYLVSLPRQIRLWLTSSWPPGGRPQ